jgi:hypothetical protein
MFLNAVPLLCGDPNKEYNIAWEYQGKMLTDYLRLDSALLQFTGLYDKHGKEIYEGDILRYTSDASVEGDVYPGKVVYEAPEFICTMNLYDALNCDWIIKKIEVIGNIYENPELLKGKNALSKMQN